MPPGSGAAIGHRRGGYRPVLRDRVTRRLLTAKLVSEVGDFVGLAALLLLAYSASQSLLGTAAVLAARGLPALAVTTVLSGWLDRPPRRTALVFLALLGAFAIAIPTAIPTTATAITAAALLGAIRAAHRSIYVAVVAESVARPLRLPLFGLSAGINQTAQVVGLLAGPASPWLSTYGRACWSTWCLSSSLPHCCAGFR